MNFPKNESFFFPEKTVPKDVRCVVLILLQIRHTVVKVKETLETDILGLKPQKWDPQVSFERGQRAPSLHKQALVDIRYGRPACWVMITR